MAQSPALHETVVTATRTQTRSDSLVSDVVVIERADIEKLAGRTLPEILQRAAGVQFSSNGGRGKVSSVFVRGTEARHTILLIDGVRYGSATVGGPIWENLPLDAIERIEVLKGPGSSLYGSDGVGGVIQVFTRKGQEGFHPFAQVGAGTDSYYQAGAGYFPFYIGLILCISGAGIFYQTVLGKNRNSEIFVDSEQLRRVLSVLLPALVYVGAVQFIGLYVGSAIYIALFMVILGKYSWVKSVIAAVSVITLFFMMFEVWFKVPLYKGMFNPLGFLGY